MSEPKKYHTKWGGGNMFSIYENDNPFAIATSKDQKYADLIKDSLNRRAGGWIKVEDRLPEDRENILAYGVLTSRGMIGMIEARDTYPAYYNAEYKQWVLRDENHILDDVTHWQPMCAPPKEKEE